MWKCANLQFAFVHSVRFQVECYKLQAAPLINQQPAPNIFGVKSVNFSLLSFTFSLDLIFPCQPDERFLKGEFVNLKRLSLIGGRNQSFYFFRRQK